MTPVKFFIVDCNPRQCSTTSASSPLAVDDAIAVGAIAAIAIGAIAAIAIDDAIAVMMPLPMILPQSPVLETVVADDVSSELLISNTPGWHLPTVKDTNTNNIDMLKSNVISILKQSGKLQDAIRVQIDPKTGVEQTIINEDMTLGIKYDKSIYKNDK